MFIYGITKLNNCVIFSPIRINGKGVVIFCAGDLVKKPSSMILFHGHIKTKKEETFVSSFLKRLSLNA